MGAALLLLADGRAPVGTYAHSFGLEAAVAAGDVHDVASLAAFVDVRLRTAGTVDAGFAAAVCVRAGKGVLVPAVLDEADAEYAARLTAPALAASSRELGRYFMRLGATAWPSRALTAAGPARPQGWHHPVALGLVGSCAGLRPGDAALCAAHGLAAGLASAGVRLLGLDPVAVYAAQARLADTLDRMAAAAAQSAAQPFADLPVRSAPLVDVRAEQHAAAGAVRLFAS